MTLIKMPGGANEQLINQSNPYSKTQSTKQTQSPRRRYPPAQFHKTNPIRSPLTSQRSGIRSLSRFIGDAHRGRTNPISHQPFGSTNFKNKPISTQSKHMLNTICYLLNTTDYLLCKTNPISRIPPPPICYLLSAI